MHEAEPLTDEAAKDQAAKIATKIIFKIYREVSREDPVLISHRILGFMKGECLTEESYSELFRLSWEKPEEAVERAFRENIELF